MSEYRKFALTITFVIFLMPLAVPAYADDAAAAGGILLNLAQDDIVMLDDFLLVAEIGEDLLDKYDDFKMIIDGKEVPVKFLEEQGILTFLPVEGFDVGKHIVKIIGENEGVEEVLTELGFGTVLKDLEKFLSGELSIEDAILALEGELSIEADFDDLEGTGQDILEREASKFLNGLTTGMATDDWDFDLLLLMDSDQGKYTQIYDRIKMAVARDDTLVNIGEVFPRYSDFTMKGRRVQGVGWSDTSSDVHFQGTVGNAVRKISPRLDDLGGFMDPGTQGLDIFGARLEVDPGADFNIGLNFVQGTGSSWGIDNEFAGNDNRVIGIDLAFEPFNGFTFGGEYAYSRTTPGGVDGETKGAAKSISAKYKSEGNSLQVSFLEVDSGFQSSGLNSIRTNTRSIKVDDRFSFDKWVTGNIRYEKSRDVPTAGSGMPRWTDKLSGRISLRPEGFSGGVDFTYRAFDRFNEIDFTAPGAFSISNDAMTFSGFFEGEWLDAHQRLRISYSDLTSTNDVNSASSHSTSDISVNLNSRFDSGIIFGLTYGSQDRSMADVSAGGVDRYIATLMIPSSDGKLVFTGNIGWLVQESGVGGMDSNRLNAKLGLSWKLTKYYSIEAWYQRLEYENEGDSSRDYSDNSFKFKLVKAF